MQIFTRDCFGDATLHSPVYPDGSPHQEGSDRVVQARAALNFAEFHSSSPPKRTKRDNEKWIHAVHDLKFMRKLAAACETAKNKRIPLSPKLLNGKGGATVVGKRSLAVAKEAVDCVIDAVDWTGEDGKRAFCLVRPPGHHATPTGPDPVAGGCGFCLLNTVAIAVAYAMELGLRPAVVDFDVHHGNGTEACLRRVDQSGKTFYGSVHLLEVFPENSDLDFFPGTGKAQVAAESTLSGPCIVNCPLEPLWVNPPKLGRRGREGFLQSFSETIIPALNKFKPDILFISAGFDGALGDTGNMDFEGQISGLDLTPEDFAAATTMICSACPRVVSVLEGGYGHLENRNGVDIYNRDGFVACVVAHVKALQG